MWLVIVSYFQPVLCRTLMWCKRPQGVPWKFGAQHLKIVESSRFSVFWATVCSNKLPTPPNRDLFPLLSVTNPCVQRWIFVSCFARTTVKVLSISLKPAKADFSNFQIAVSKAQDLSQKEKGGNLSVWRVLLTDVTSAHTDVSLS